MTTTPTITHLDRNPLAEPGAEANSPAKVRESARQFEALLIGQIMRTMRESSGGWLGSGEDQAGSSMSDFAEQQMAQVLSLNGGFGLASLIEQGLTQTTQPRPPIAGSPIPTSTQGSATTAELLPTQRKHTEISPK